MRSKSIRSLQISVKPFQGVLVRLPASSTSKSAWKFIEKQKRWIHKASKKAESIENDSAIYFGGYTPVPQDIIESTLVKRLEVLAQRYRFSYARITIRNQKSRWGSCSASNNISLNKKLYHLPDNLRDYVLIHELAHTRQKNHSHKFWDILYQIMGESHTKHARRKLKDFEFLFYPPPGTGTTFD